MAKGKMLMLAGAAVVVIGVAIGGALGVMALMSHGATNAHAAKPKPVVVPPKPILFAQLGDIVVSVPTDTGAPASSFVQFAIQFATTDPNAVTSFTALQPIIKANVISLLMNETGSSLQQAATRDALLKNCLGIANNVLNKSAGYTPPSPFTAAYITNLVVQE